MSIPRFIGRSEGEFAFLKDDELHHAKVKRVKVGHQIEINDLKGNVYLSKVEEITKKYLKAKIIKILPQQEPKIKINLFIAVPNKLSKIDDLIEPISQLGVYSLTPVFVKNSALKEKDVNKKLEKWKKIALNSIKQCKRLYPILINPPIKIKDVPLAEKNFLFYEKEKKLTLKEFINDKARYINIIIGNEGGFTEEEVEILKNKGFITVSLGDYILTMETAVVVSLCQINFIYNN